MSFKKVVPEWNAQGVEPPASLKNTGFEAGYKPPAAFFNWFWHGVSEALSELQSMKPENIGAAPSSHGRHVPSVCVSITDWNNAVENGWYMGNNAANAPTRSDTSVWYFGHVIAHNENYVFQEVYHFTSSTDASQNNKYIRAKMNGAWGEWVHVTVQRAVPKDAKLDYIKTLRSDAQSQIDGKMNTKPGYIELVPASTAGYGGYLDFHYNGSEKDYTTRVIESKEGVLQILGTILKASSFGFNNGTGLIESDKNCIALKSIGEDGSSGTRLFLNNVDAQAISEALTLSGPSGTSYKVYGEHNNPAKLVNNSSQNSKSTQFTFDDQTSLLGFTATGNYSASDSTAIRLAFRVNKDTGEITARTDSKAGTKYPVLYTSENRPTPAIIGAEAVEPARSVSATRNTDNTTGGSIYYRKWKNVVVVSVSNVMIGSNVTSANTTYAIASGLPKCSAISHAAICTNSAYVDAFLMIDTNGTQLNIHTRTGTNLSNKGIYGQLVYFTNE
jgi:hypothetical protein